MPAALRTASRAPAAPAAAIWVALLAMLLPAPAFAAVPIPADKQLGAQVVATIAGAGSYAMHMPTAVAIDAKGRILVADGANDRIVRFSEGKPDAAIAQIGELKLRRPVGLCVDAADRLWIADTGNGRLVLADAEARQARAVELPKAEDGHAAEPTAIAVSPDGKRVYVADSRNHRILTRSGDQGAWLTLGRPGRGIGQFQYPCSVCVGAEQYLYIVEALGARVQQLSPANRWAGVVGRWGVELGQFYRPKGIAADAAGRVYVSDSTLNVVQVFSARGALEGVLAGPDGKPLRFAHPMGLAFDRSGRLYVVELAANRAAVVSIAASARPTTKPATRQEGREPG